MPIWQPEEEGLHSCITGTFRHNIKQLTVRLGVQLIKHNAVDVEAVLGIRFCGKHLVEAVRWCVDDPFL